MAIEYLLVTFPEQRAVLADDAGVGFSNHILMLPGDEYRITLEGGGCVPPFQDIALAGTSIVKPMVLAFAQEAAAERPAADTAAPAAADAMRAMAPNAMERRKPRTAAAGPGAVAKGMPGEAKAAGVKPARKAGKDA